MQAFISAIQQWFKKPFDPNGSVLAWGLFVLLLIILCIIWANVISYFGKAAKTTMEIV